MKVLSGFLAKNYKNIKDMNINNFEILTTKKGSGKRSNLLRSSFVSLYGQGCSFVVLLFWWNITLVQPYSCLYSPLLESIIFCFKKLQHN